jgi:hypothetical protein
MHGILPFMVVESPSPDNSQQTATKATQILEKKPGFRILEKNQRKELVKAFISTGKVVYGRAFDVIKISGRGAGSLRLHSEADFLKHIERITLCEVKSTRRDLNKHFDGYFFGLTTAELLVAQTLGDQYGFVLVNTKTEAFLELSLHELLGRANKIYPVWNISLRPLKPKV